MPSSISLNLTPRFSKYRLYAVISVMSMTELSVGGSISDHILGGGTTENPIARMPMVIRYGLRRGQGDERMEIVEVVPYIPASTIKGLLRSVAERLIAEKSRRYSVEQLLKQLAAVLNEDKSLRGVLSEVVEKLVDKLLQQYIDEKYSSQLVNVLKNPKEFESFVAQLDDEEKLADYLREKGIPPELAGIIKALLESSEVCVDACNPVIEGLCCELPLPRYKLAILKALARGLSLDNVEYPCKVCRVFGLPGYMSRLYVLDAYPIRVKDMLVMLRTHIALDRLRGSVAYGRTFDLEFVAPGAEFLAMIAYDVESSITQLHPPREEPEKPLALLDELKVNGKPIGEVEEGVGTLYDVLKHVDGGTFWIGRRKTWGMGKVRMEIKAITVKDVVEDTVIAGRGYVENVLNLLRDSMERGVPKLLIELLEHEILKAQASSHARR